MDSGDRPVTYRPGWTNLYVNARVPSELKYLVTYYNRVAKHPSFAYTIRILLETHPTLAQMAAELYNDSKASNGPDTPTSIGT